jgi:hypothetical protein
MELHYFAETKAALLIMISYFKKISWDPLLQIWVPSGEAYSSIVIKKTSSIPCLEGKFLKVLHLPRHLNWQFLMSPPSRYLNGVVVRCN